MDLFIGILIVLGVLYALIVVEDKLNDKDK
jgi:hypothetical protein